MIETLRSVKLSAIVMAIACVLVHANLGTTQAAAQDPERPNFVLIFVDDLGYGDIRAFNPDSAVETPHLDRMAAEGRKLTSFYVAAPVCTPSRAALLTGSYPRRVQMRRQPNHAVSFPGDARGLNPDEITIADMLKEQGYHTGMFGKWHLGDQPEFLPTEQGFDTFLGIPYSNDMWPHHPRGFRFPPLPLMRDTEVIGVIENMEDQGQLARWETEAAIEFILEHQDEPFFAYIPHAWPHLPRWATDEFMEKADGNETHAQVMELDYRLGQILETLEEAGIAENTLVMFTSDNGPAPRLSSGPLRGRKGSIHEGGVRVPMIAWWPGRIPAGTETDEMTIAMDILPTFAELAGGTVPTDRIIDGKSITSLLLEDGARTPHDRLYYDWGGNPGAVRSGPWKLFHNGRLFNLNRDISESNNVADAHPNVVERLQGYLDEFMDLIEEDIRPAGEVETPRTILPRPGWDQYNDNAYAPTHDLGQ